LGKFTQVAQQFPPTSPTIPGALSHEKESILLRTTFEALGNMRRGVIFQPFEIKGSN
jgi:hypothetical protein